MIFVDVFFTIILAAYCYWLWGLLAAFRSDAPYVPIRRAVLQRIMELVSPPAGALWIDLGSGDGRVLIAAVQKFGVKGIGIERVSALRQLARYKILVRGLLGKIRIRKGDFFATNLGNADVVSFYLLPETSAKLIDKLRAELRPGTILVFHRYPIEGLPLIAEDKAYKIYVAKI